MSATKKPKFRSIETKPISETFESDQRIVSSKYISGKSNTITNLPYSSLSGDALTQLLSLVLYTITITAGLIEADNLGETASYDPSYVVGDASDPDFWRGLTRGMYATGSITNKPGDDGFVTVKKYPTGSVGIFWECYTNKQYRAWVNSAAVSVDWSLADNTATLLAKVYPVGSIYTNASNSTNPATLLGFGTWSAAGAGRVLVGKNTSGTFATAGATGGAEKHTLTVAELPPVSGSWTIHGQENGTIFYTKSGYATGTLSSNKYTSTSAQTGANSYQTPGFSFGSGSAHNNLPPYLVVYMWVRTA